MNGTVLDRRIEVHELETLAERVAGYYERHDLDSDAYRAYQHEMADTVGASGRVMVALVNDRPGDPWSPTEGDRRHDRNLTAILRRTTGSTRATALHFDAAHPRRPQLCWPSGR